jgi:4-amino-4-deoxy-L-arabinose transferase-like glycosyltransferase
MFSCFTLLAILQFCLLLNHRDITTAHEGRVASTAREMLADGDWLVPHSNGVTRIVKPPLPYWAVAATWKVLGDVDVWSARLPSALLGAIGVLLIMDLGRRVLGGGHATAIVCGLVWISTWFIVDEYRKAMADPYLAFFTLFAIWSWIAAHYRPTPGQSAAPPRTVLLLLFYVSAALGALAKGHLILVHLALALVGYHLICLRRPPRRTWAHLAGVALLFLIALPWFAYVLLHVPNTIREWQEDAAGANATLGAKHGPIFHYLINLPLTAAPWSVLLVVGLLMPWLGRRRRDSRHAWAVVWLALTVLVFSLVSMKKNSYLLPVMPAQTLIIAAPIVSILRSRQPNRGDRFLFAAHAIAAGACLCVVIALVLSSERVDMERPGPMLTAAGIGIFLLIGARSLSAKLISLRTFALSAIGFALAVCGTEAWVFPDHDNRRSDAPFADAVKAQVGQVPLRVVGAGLREDVLFYLGRTVEVIPTAEALPADYAGFAIVTADQYPGMSRLDRGDEIAESAGRAEGKDRLVLMKFPKDPNFRAQQQQR